MPSSPDYSSPDQDFLTPPYLREESPKARTIPTKAQNKLRKKHELAGDQADKEKAPKSRPQNVDSTLPIPPSLGSPLASTPPTIYPANSITSPVLAALGANAFGNPAYGASAWPSDLPFDGSPPKGNGNGTSIAGSPPNKVPLNDEAFRGGFATASPSTSPQAAYRLPVRRSNGYQGFGDHYLGSAPARSRPMSMPPQYAQGPPLPHHPQAHFYGVRDSDLGLHSSRGTSRKPGTGEYCSFGSLSSSGGDGATIGDNVLLLAFDKGLMVYGVDRGKLEVLGRLEGLRGSVVGATIVPSGSKEDQLRSSRPLIAVIVHGPLLPVQPGHRPDPGRSNDDDFDPSASMIHALQSADANVPRSPDMSQYQTTVEIYSLKERCHITTLFKSPVVQLEKHEEQLCEHPSPIGNLGVHAKGRFIIVTSGISGEVYVFEVSRSLSPQSPESFKCLGKTWTSIPVRKPRAYSASSTSSEVDSASDGSPARATQPDEAMVSLSHRWLAIVPPVPSTRSTLHGITDLPGPSKVPPGLTSHTSSSQPQVTCDLDSPLEESLINKVARDVTQEFIKGARWVGDQGMQAWKNYWHKSSEPSSPYEYGMHPPLVPSAPQQFPPTHAHDDRNRSSQQPTLVSILDLERLSEHQDAKPGMALQPVATFSLPSGCSFISFSPSGLHILTASAKGDVQFVWDLMRVIHGKAGIISLVGGSLPDKGPTVRQIARFTRMTVANIVDVVWTEPTGEQLAIVTDRGTVHVFDMPPSAFQWPPPRRLARSVTTPEPQIPNPAGVSSPGGAFSAAITMVSGTTQPLLAAVRGRPPSIGSAISGFGGFNLTAGAGAKGGRMVATGFSKSVGAATGTVNTIRHMGENRFHVPKSTFSLTRGCVRWMSGKDRNHVAVVGGGLLRIHDIRLKSGDRGKRQMSVVGDRVNEMNLPKIISDASSPFAMQNNPNGPCQTPFTIYWPPPGMSLVLQRSVRGKAHPLSSAEIETNAPYQPFHTDRRINLYIYTDTNRHVDDTSARVFGEEIPTIKFSIGLDSPAETALSLESPPPMENLISLAGDDEAGQQVVVTTRRKRGKKSNTDADDDFFEQDMDVVDFVDSRV